MEELTTENVAIELLKLENQKKSINDDIKDLKKEAKNSGVEMKQVMNAIKILKRILKDEDKELVEEEFLVEKFNQNIKITNLIQDLLEQD